MSKTITCIYNNRMCTYDCKGCATPQYLLSECIKYIYRSEMVLTHENEK